MIYIYIYIYIYVNKCEINIFEQNIFEKITKLKKKLKKIMLKKQNF